MRLADHSHLEGNRPQSATGVAERTSNFIGIGSLLVAAAILALTLLPGTLWHHPTNDQVYRGLDSNLVYTSAKGDGQIEGTAKVTNNSLELTAPATAEPTANLLTTPLPKLDVALDVVVIKNPAGSNPLRIGVWSPAGASGYFLNFGAGPASLITAETVANGLVGHTLLAQGDEVSQSLGSYEPGRTYHLGFTVDKETGTLIATVAGAGTALQSRVTAAELPRVFSSVRISLTASAGSTSATSTVLLKNYKLTLPHAAFWADKVNDPKVTYLSLSLGVLGGLLLVVAGLRRLRQLPTAVATILTRQRQRRLITTFLRRRRLLVGVSAVVVGFLIANALLFALGGHPFDMANEKLYAYVAVRNGTSQLYYLPNLVSFPAIWGGIPYSEAAFPYEPALAYVFTGVGWIARNLLPPDSFTPASSSLEYVIKAANVAFGLADSVLIYLILKQLNVSRRWSLIGASAFLLNPAVWFSMSVWGQTHVISIFFLLAAVLFAQRAHPVAAWALLAAAALTRPQMLPLTFLMAIVLLRKFPLRWNLAALSQTIIATFIMLLPLSLKTGPSLVVDILTNTIHIQEGGGNGPGLTTVSQDAYSIWPLVTLFRNGASGLYRSFLTSAQPLWGTLSYQRAGLIAATIALAAAALLILRLKRFDLDSGTYLPFVTAGFIAFLMFTTGLVATHFLLALPLLLLCRRWIGSVSYVAIIVGWSVTTLVPMYGDMGNVIRNLNYPLLSPEHNGVTAFFVGLYSWDRFITFGTVTNIAILVSIVVIALRAKFEPSLKRSTAD